MSAPAVLPVAARPVAVVAAPSGAAASAPPFPPVATVARYGRRNWAVYDHAGALVCVTLYKRGAVEVVRRLTRAALLLLAASCAGREVCP